ncbi:MAG: Rieske (2Fe-2S) protein [Actinobacteria bacterium]|nr:Rieske (2Fe-2S) protein [Actinomycetota bacterium]MCA1722286.1 Rieske (2Fe-2S) protein [Actinomycetota bacterium]
MTGPDRRTVLRAACAGCAGLLAGCASSDAPAPALAESPARGGSSPAPLPPLVALGDLPVGSSVAARGRVIVTRTSETEAVAFSAICTHQGCTVEPDSTSLGCPCHGSTYDPKTGAVLTGPARRPLDEVGVVVRNGGVYRR